MLNREVAEFGVLRGGKRQERALSLPDKLYRDGAIDVDQWLACGTLRNMIMMEIPPSEGVSSYGQRIKAAEASTKADRAGRRYTGFQVQPDGRLVYPGGRLNRRNHRELEDAIFAAVGVSDRFEARWVNVQHANMLIRIVTHTESMPTLTEVSRELSGYYTGAKQMPPFALGVISTWLGRLVLHFKDVGKA